MAMVQAAALGVDFRTNTKGFAVQVLTTVFQNAQTSLPPTYQESSIRGVTWENLVIYYST
jgi:hypothetical protein